MQRPRIGMYPAYSGWSDPFKFFRGAVIFRSWTPDTYFSECSGFTFLVVILGGKVLFLFIHKVQNILSIPGCFAEFTWHTPCPLKLFPQGLKHSLVVNSFSLMATWALWSVDECFCLTCPHRLSNGSSTEPVSTGPGSSFACSSTSPSDARCWATCWPACCLELQQWHTEVNKIIKVIKLFKVAP